MTEVHKKPIFIQFFGWKRKNIDMVNRRYIYFSEHFESPAFENN